LGGDYWVRRIIGEASVHLPARGRIWMASFTGAYGGQDWKSTGTDNKSAAMVIAKEFEAAARAQRAKSGSTGKKQRMRVRQSPGSSSGGLTQREVALFLGLSERAVRGIEKRALQKLAQHPRLPELWRQYLAGELTEQWHWLSAAEVRALLGLARSRAEMETIRKVLELVQG
jgi:hypothetical protein